MRKRPWTRLGQIRQPLIVFASVFSLNTAEFLKNKLRDMDLIGQLMLSDVFCSLLEPWIIHWLVIMRAG